MAIKEIVTLPDPILRRKAHRITRFDKDLQDFITDMVDTMREAPGVGLAAPQVGVSSRLIVVEFGDEEDDQKPKKLYVLANPEIVEKSGALVNGVEGCLSVPGLIGEVERYPNIVIRGLNRYGKPTKIKAQGWLARIFQHEIDHIEGVLFSDVATRVWQPTEEEAQAVVD